MKQFPDFLKEYETALQKYRQRSARILAEPLNDGETTDIKSSKFLGPPYLPVGTDYPKDKDGKPLILWAQLNFSEIPHLDDYPENGIVQFFVSADKWYDCEEIKVLFHAHTDSPPQTDFPFLTEDLYEECPIWCEHRLQFKEAEEYGGTEDFRCSCMFNGKSPWELYDTLEPAQKEVFDDLFYGTGHKIGGYSYFTQTDPRDYGQEHKNDVSLLQIDSDDKITFGDAGTAHFFINKDDLKNRNFGKVWMYWDCC